jgi:hypothetical protein
LTSTGAASVNTPNAADVTGGTSPGYSACSDREKEAAGAASTMVGGLDRDGAMIELKVPGATYTCPGSINAAGEVSGVYSTNAAETPLAMITRRGFVAKVQALVVR